MGSDWSNKGAVLMMAMCAVLWSTGGIFIKLLPWNAFVIAGARSLIAAAGIFAYMRYRGIAFCLNRISALSGGFIAVTFLAFVSANKLTTAANAVVLQYTAPVFVVVLSSLFLGQRFRKSDYTVIAVTTLGIALCFAGELSSGSLPGNSIGVLSGVAMAGMFLVTGNADMQSRMNGILLGQIFTALAGLPMLFFFPASLSGGAAANILALGILQVALPYMLYAVAARDCSPLVCCLIAALEPLLNPLWVFLMDGETPGVFSLAGGVVVIAAVTLWCADNAKAAKREKDPSA